MPRRKSPGHRRVGNAPPPVFKPQALVIDFDGLKNAYEWFAVDKIIAMKLAFEWYANNVPFLLAGHPFDEARQKDYERAGKMRNIGDNTTFPEEQITSYEQALKRYEKIWSMHALPKVDEATQITTVSQRVADVQTVLKVLNTAFPGMKFRMTLSADRSFDVGEILIPKTEIEHMIPMTPLSIVLNEVVTVAKVKSIVTEDGVQTMDGTLFMQTLPVMLADIGKWANTDKSLATKSVGKAVFTAPAASKVSNTPTTRAPRQTVHGSMTITVIGSVPRMNGKRRQALDTVMLCGTVREAKVKLTAINMAGYHGWAIKTLIQANAISVQ